VRPPDVVVVRDVGELRQAEAQRTRLAAAVEQASDFIVVNDFEFDKE
jgi:hypothetical protein